MSIIRVKKDKNHPYLIMNKTGLNDKRLSLKAKGLLCYLLSKPDNWYIDTKELTSNNSNGLKSILSTINELVHFSYIQKLQLRNNNGQYQNYNYLVFENPYSPNPIKTTTSPKRPFRLTDNPLTDKDTLLINNKKESNDTTATPHSKYPSFNTMSAADIDILNTKTETKKLLNQLKIKNHKKLFDIFPISDIFKYATWIHDRNVRMKNPTGFLITAIKQKWIDNIDTHGNDQEHLLFYYRCQQCHRVFGYQDPIHDYSFCNKCTDQQ